MFQNNPFNNNMQFENFQQSNFQNPINFQQSNFQNSNFQQSNFQSSNFQNFQNPNNNNPINNNNTIPININENENKEEKLNPKTYIPERSLSNYFNQNFLSDGSLKGKDFNVQCHKIILCASSNYINEYLKNSNDKEIPIPEYIQSDFSKASSKEAIDIILKYAYSNQNVEEIRNLINENNIFTILQFSHCLGIQNLNNFLEDLMI